MINHLTLGYLKYPSDKLFNLLSSLERALLQTVGLEQLNFYTFQHVAQNVMNETMNFVGCKTHQETLTRKIINYYLMARTKILCKVHNKVYGEARKKEQELRKMAKLVGKKDDLLNKKINKNIEKQKPYQKKAPTKRKTSSVSEKNNDQIKKRKAHTEKSIQSANVNRIVQLSEL